MKRIIITLGITVALTVTLRAADLATYKTADELWQHIQQLQQGPSARPTSQDEAKTVMTAFLTDLDQALGAFIDRYPQDERHWEAEHTRVAVGLFRAQVEDKTPDRAAAEKKLNEIINAAAAPEKVRKEARCTLIELQNDGLDDSSKPADRAAVEKEIVAFQKDYPQDPRTTALSLMRVGLFEQTDPDKAASLLKELAKDPDPELQGEVQQRLKLLELRKKPVELQFTAVDGREVNLDKWRGKVVLLDFWATWCPPCRAEMPNVVATYRKYHDKGFEIVGISLDRDKNKLLAFTKENGMVWPQYFDGQAWQNAISQRFEVRSIPTAWLLDKTGKLRAADLHGAALGKEVAKLLVE